MRAASLHGVFFRFTISLNTHSTIIHHVNCVLVSSCVNENMN